MSLNAGSCISLLLSFCPPLYSLLQNWYLVRPQRFVLWDQSLAKTTLVSVLHFERMSVLHLHLHAKYQFWKEPVLMIRVSSRQTPKHFVKVVLPLSNQIESNIWTRDFAKCWRQSPKQRPTLYDHTTPCVSRIDYAAILVVAATVFGWMRHLLKEMENPRRKFLGHHDYGMQLTRTSSVRRNTGKPARPFRATRERVKARLVHDRSQQSTPICGARTKEGSYTQILKKDLKAQGFRWRLLRNFKNMKLLASYFWNYGFKNPELWLVLIVILSDFRAYKCKRNQNRFRTWSLVELRWVEPEKRNALSFIKIVLRQGKCSSHKKKAAHHSSADTSEKTTTNKTWITYAKWTSADHTNNI